MNLNSGQEAAAEAFFNFLFQEGKEFIISGPAGTGKTFLMGYIIDIIMPRYKEICSLMGLEVKYDDVVMTATTNKAAAILGTSSGRPTSTIHSFLNLRIKEDYSSGITKLIKTNNWTVYEKKIIFIDECSMINTELYNIIQEGSHNCKIIYIGDHCQLAPIFEPISPIYTKNLPIYYLTEPVRNAESPELQNVCSILRNVVETREFSPIPTYKGRVEHLNDSEMEAKINEIFLKDEPNAKILAFTNRRVMEFNNHILSIKGYTDEYIKDGKVINNSPISKDKMNLFSEQEITIKDVGAICRYQINNTEAFMDVRHLTILPQFSSKEYEVYVPIDKGHFNSLIRYFGREKDWENYFFLKNTFPDFRQVFASTIHKSQGSTYDEVFIDLTDIASCTRPNEVARMLYVAFSRARKNIYLWGNLPLKYGGIR